MKKHKPDLLLLLLILVVGAVLRFYNWQDLPFTYDEFSALFRTNFDSFQDLIQKGVKIDGHPAGIHVFLYWLVNIFGYSEVAIKIPFILFGLGGIIYTYLIGKEWFGSTTGLVSAVFVACLQYTVMYSQIARPYISGFFFAGIMVYHWYRVINSKDKVPWIHLIVYIIGSSLCSYNHHFSLLFVAVVGITGLFMIGKKNILIYLIAEAIIIILYIPHLPILFFQLSLGGVEQWLAKPDIGFLASYFGWIFHYYSVLLIIVALLFLYSTYNLIKEKKVSRYFWISLIWFLIPLLAGLVYSIKIAAVLQFSVLIFTFPFLLYVLFAGLPEMKFWMKGVLISVLMLVSISTLIKNRDHYNIMYKSAYEQMIIESDNALQKYGDDCRILLDTHEKYSQFYLDKHGFDIAINYYDHDMPWGQMDSILQNIPENILLYGCISDTPPILFSIIQEHFPYLIQQKDYYIGNVFVFSRVYDQDQLENRDIISHNTIEPAVKDWQYDVSAIIQDTINKSNNFYQVKSGEEYTMTYSIPMKKLNIGKNDFIDIRARVQSKESIDALIVSDLLEKDESIHWSANSLMNFHSDDWFNVYHSVKLSDLDHTKNSELKVYIWNKDHKEFLVDEIEISLRRGNPRLYGLFEEI